MTTSDSPTAAVTVVDHPVLQHLLGELRDRGTAPPAFRAALRTAGWILGYEALRDLAQTEGRVETPMAPTTVRRLAAPLPLLVTVLRAGNGLLTGVLDLLPEAPVVHLGLYRDHRTLEVVEYYRNLPSGVAQRRALVCDPMLATGHTSVAAVGRVKESGAGPIDYLCLVAAPEGLAELGRRHPDIRIWTAAIDERLNERGYILPGLGDAGDRLYGKP